MKLITSLALTIILCSQILHADIFQSVLKDAAKNSGYLPSHEINPEFDNDLAAIGKLFFESEKLSYNSSIACKNCHLSEFSSTDGLPNAIGVGGHGVGLKRVESGGLIVPRNVLPLWGRGTDFFDKFFWDGKVEKTDDGVFSQFYQYQPSDNPLIVASLLPIVEIREMVLDDYDVNKRFKKEQVEVALEFYQEIFGKIQDEQMMRDLAEYFKINTSEIKLQHVGSAIAEHIKKEFKLEKTKFELFMNEEDELSSSELKGGLLFYGKGKCIVCHNGPLFSDLKYHTIVFPQTGFGKNGFGVDYGRFNVSRRYNDLYKFRTPPLIEVVNTAPYGHSGSTYSLRDAIAAHFDPLRFIDLNSMNAAERTEYFRSMQLSRNSIQIPYLDEKEIENIEAFLKTLSFLQ